MKKCYAYYSVALTAFLQNDLVLADYYISQAKALNAPNESEVVKLIAYDVKELGIYKTSYLKQLNAFKTKYNL